MSSRLGQAFLSVIPSVLPSSSPHSIVVSFLIFKSVYFEHFHEYLCILYLSSLLLLMMGISRNVLSKYDSYCSPCFKISKENEFHRKYKVLGGSTESAKAPPILEIEQNGWFHWI